ncbi:Ctr copper transporter family protein [Teladorsagia circumcincta]|uniref:Copper transport protein n=1 Tax=Teladorsagia circumcincta TaxID=45464 RepID=A0A2G9U2U9_TELCI|nr:Ctr copper transporter family protein [Teladorsagia circumcincta]
MEPTAVVGASTYMPPMSSTHLHMKMKPMWMWFHTTVNDVVLFESWTVTTPGDMVWSCLAVMAMGVLLEFVRYARWRFEIGHTKDAFLNTNYMSRLFSLTHILQTVMFAVQLIISYFLMLVFMTFSIWLGIAVCVGAGWSSNLLLNSKRCQVHGVILRSMLHCRYGISSVWFSATAAIVYRIA